MVVSFIAVADREFSVVRGGYDREEVKAYLGEVETSFRQLERWVEEAKARLKIAEEKGRRPYNVVEPMLAVFAAKDRVLDRGRLQAERIKAEAREQARADYEDAAAAVIAEAAEEGRRIIEEARGEVERLMAQPEANVTSSEDAAGDSLVVDLTHDGGADEAEDDGAPRRTRYERRSAKLPSIGEDASDILRSLESLREDSSTD
jgi:DivIVA domain-containing protein